MRTFFHINEYRAKGFELLPYYTVLSQPTVIWAPAVSFLKTSGSFLTPPDLLELVKRGEIVIAGRDWWLCNKDERNRKAADPQYGFPEAKWTQFDSEVLELAEADREKATTNKRVIVCRKAKGDLKAAERLSKSDGGIVRPRVRGLFRSRMLPPGMLEKAETLRKQNKPYVAKILSDYYNHSDACREVLAPVPVLPSEFSGLIGTVEDYLVKVVSPSETVSNTELHAAVVLLRSLSTGFDSSKDFLSYLKKKKRDRESLQNVLLNARKKTVPLGRHVRRQVADRFDFQHRIRNYLPYTGEPIQDAISMASIIDGVLAALLGAPPVLAGASFVINASPPTLRRLSLIPAKKTGKNTDVDALMYFVFRTRRLTRKQATDLLDLLDNYSTG